MNIAEQMAKLAENSKGKATNLTCEKLLKEVIPFLAKNGRRKILIRKENRLICNINILNGFFYVNKRIDLTLLKEELEKRGFNSKISASANELVVKW